MSAVGRFCCKSLFALVIKNIPGFRRDFRAKMRGTSSPNDKLADDLGNAIEGTRINGCRSDFLTAGKLAPGNLGLLQQYRQDGHPLLTPPLRRLRREAPPPRSCSLGARGTVHHGWLRANAGASGGVRWPRHQGTPSYAAARLWFRAGQPMT